MPSSLEYEQRMHAMVRMMFGDIRDYAKSQIYELYDANEKAKSEELTYKESCARWHWILEVYSKNREEIQEYVDWIQIAHMSEEDLDNDELWLMEMRRFLPSQFMEKIEHTGFTQVPRGAIMDQTPLKREKKEGKTYAIFRKDIR